MWAGYGAGTAIAGGLSGPGDNGGEAFTTAAAAALAAAVSAALLCRPTPANRTAHPDQATTSAKP